MKAIEDEEMSVRWVAASHPNATEAVLLKALEDENLRVRAVATTHPNFTPALAAKAATTATTHDVLQSVAAREDIDDASRVMAALRDPGNYLGLGM